jgi:hypothetical protein
MEAQMRGFSGRLSYANVISSLALFAALTGGTALALEGKNTVDSGDIKKNAVKTSDIAADAATGNDVNESTLGKVPSAATADSATTAGSAATAAAAQTAATSDSVKTLVPIGMKTMNKTSPGPTLVTHGPFTIRGSCTGPGGVSVAEPEIASLEANSAFEATSQNNTNFNTSFGGSAAFSPMTGAGSSGGPAIEVVTFAAFAPSGKAISGVINTFAHDAGNPQCRFHGHVILEG